MPAPAKSAWITRAPSGLASGQFVTSAAVADDHDQSWTPSEALSRYLKRSESGWNPPYKLLASHGFSVGHAGLSDSTRLQRTGLIESLLPENGEKPFGVLTRKVI
jgi:hypothetical protein